MDAPDFTADGTSTYEVEVMIPEVDGESQLVVIDWWYNSARMTALWGLLGTGSDALGVAKARWVPTAGTTEVRVRAWCNGGSPTIKAGDGTDSDATAYISVKRLSEGAGNPTRRTLQLKVFADNVDAVSGDGKLTMMVDQSMNGWTLAAVAAYVSDVSSSGAVTVQLHNVTDAVDILSTAITIDASEFSSYTAATPPVINTSNDDVATGDLIRIDVDGAGTDAKGLGVILTFQAP